MTADVMFEPVPRKRNGTGGGRKTGIWLAELKARPGEWARLPISYTGASKYRVRHPDCEFIQRTLDDGVKALYGRYMGNA